VPTSVSWAGPELSGLKTAPVSLRRDRGVSVTQVTHHNKWGITSSGRGTERWSSFSFAHKIKSTWQLQTWHEFYIAVTSVSHLLSCKE